MLHVRCVTVVVGVSVGVGVTFANGPTMGLLRLLCCIVLYF